MNFFSDKAPLRLKIRMLKRDTAMDSYKDSPTGNIAHEIGDDSIENRDDYLKN